MSAVVDDDPAAPPGVRRVHPAELALLVSVFVVAACGLVYELAAGAMASYLLGDSVTQFSTVIGTYLFAMGIGSWLSRFVERQLVAQFLRIELLVGVIGGLLPAILFALHTVAAPSFRLVLYGLVLLVGILVGLEIPLVMRILKRHFAERYALRELVSQVLTFDYLGALAVALAFPLLLVPQFGLIRTGLLFGLMNVAVAAWALWIFRGTLRRRGAHVAACAGAAGLLLAAFALADHITTWAEDRFYGDAIVVRETSPYQRVVATASHGNLRLYLNGNLQFDAHDEYRYHEALVQPAMAAQGAPKRVLVLGGGDGLAVREVLRHGAVEQVTVVDLDAQVTRLAATLPALRQLNGDAFASPKVTVVNDDAFAWLERTPGHWDVIVVDFPDPSNFALGKLYSTSFYRLLDAHLSAGGYAVVQTTSPLLARRSFWTVVTTIEEVGLTATPYHAHVPSFGEWGFVIAARRPWRMPAALPAALRFLNVEGLSALFQFPPDMARVPAEPNRLSNQALVRVFEEEWGAVHR
jgi:spermidine synthase